MSYDERDRTIHEYAVTCGAVWEDPPGCACVEHGPWATNKNDAIYLALEDGWIETRHGFQCPLHVADSDESGHG